MFWSLGDFRRTFGISGPSTSFMVAVCLDAVVARTGIGHVFFGPSLKKVEVLGMSTVANLNKELDFVCER